MPTGTGRARSAAGEQMAERERESGAAVGVAEPIDERRLVAWSQGGAGQLRDGARARCRQCGARLRRAQATSDSVGRIEAGLRSGLRRCWPARLPPRRPAPDRRPARRRDRCSARTQGENVHPLRAAAVRRSENIAQPSPKGTDSPLPSWIAAVRSGQSARRVPSTRAAPEAGLA